MHAATHLRVEWTALLLGVALAGLAVAGWRVDGGLTVPPAEVSLVTSASDTLAIPITAGQPFATDTSPDADGPLRPTSTCAASTLSIARAVWFSSRTPP